MQLVFKIDKLIGSQKIHNQRELTVEINDVEAFINDLSDNMIDKILEIKNIPSCDECKCTLRMEEIKDIINYD